MHIAHRYRPLMLPSLGFFGGTWADRLSVDVGKSVRGVVVRIDSKAPSFLNLRGIRLIRDGRVLPVAKSMYTVEQSSNRPESNLQVQGIQELSGLHSVKEVAPWWKCTFSEETLVDEVHVFNRRDRLGSRSRRLAVDVIGDDGTFETLYSGHGEANFRKVLRTIESYSGGRRSSPVIDSFAAASKWRTDTVRLVNDALKAGAPVPSASEWLDIAALIPTAGERGLEGEDWFLLAYGLSAQLKRDERSRSGIYSYSGVLNSRDRLARLEEEFDDARRALDGQPLQLLKHGVSPMGALRRDLKGIERLFPLLQEHLAQLEKLAMLCYGTLLGARRNARIMDHDDDFDLITIIDAESMETFESEKYRLLSHLRACGWNVSENGKNQNVHLGRDGIPGHLDLFCARRSGDAVETHMERMVWRAVPARIFEAVEEITLEGKKYPAPGRIDEFLEERYGPTWRKPDKYHDWRWPLVDDA